MKEIMIIREYTNSQAEARWQEDHTVFLDQLHPERFLLLAKASGLLPREVLMLIAASGAARYSDLLRNQKAQLIEKLDDLGACRHLIHDLQLGADIFEEITGWSSSGGDTFAGCNFLMLRDLRKKLEAYEVENRSCV